MPPDIVEALCKQAQVLGYIREHRVSPITKVRAAECGDPSGFIVSWHDMPHEDPIKLWQHFHGASVHFALALTVISFAFDLGSNVFNKKEWRTAGFWSLVVAVCFALPAIVSGLWGQLGWFKAEKWVTEPEAHLYLHRNFALGGSLTLVLLLMWRSLTRDFGVSRSGLERRGDQTFNIYLLIALLATLTIGYTGYLGSYVARGY